MKGKILTILALVVLSLVAMTACSGRPSKSGEFKSDTYVLSIGDSIDLYNEITMKNGEKSDVAISLSNGNLSLSSDNTFEAVKSGQTIAFANYNGQSFAQCKIIIRYKFSAPSNISVDENGNITWNRSFAMIEGQEVFATDYTLSIANVTGLEQIDYDSIIFEEIEVGESYQISQPGSYCVKLMANAIENDNIDSSQQSKMVVLNYKVMGRVENLNILPSSFSGNQSSTISWDEKENAIYNIYAEGFLIEENLEGNSFDYDFSFLQAGESVPFMVVAIDKNGIFLETNTSFTVTGLETPAPVYSNDTEGFISWQSVENASTYLFNFISLDDATVQQSFVVQSGQNSNQVFDSLPSGNYRLYASAQASVSQGQLYSTSTLSEVQYYTKLNTPQSTVTFDGKTLNVDIEEDSYNKNYKATIEDRVFYFSSNQFSIDLDGFDLGLHTLSITALPNPGQMIIVNQDQTSNPLNSNPFTFDFYILDTLGEIHHSLDQERNISIFSLSTIENANYYKLYINDILFDIEPYIENNIVSFTVENLNQIQPSLSGYEIMVTAGNNIDGIEYAPLSTTTKTLEILPLVQKSTSEQNGYYIWDNLDQIYQDRFEEEVSYYYEIFKSNKDYTNIEEPSVQSGWTMDGKNQNALEFGYYIIHIYAHSNDTNLYLDNTFHDKENFFTGEFFVTEQIATPTAVLTRDGEFKDNYYLSISTVEYGGGYVVYVDGEFDGQIEVNSDTSVATYTFSNTFEKVKNYDIALIATSGSRFDGQLHLNSEEYHLNIEKLPQPTFSYREAYDDYGTKIREDLTIASISNLQQIKIKIDDVIVNASSNNTIDLYSYDNEFTLNLQYIAIDGGDNQFYINSDERIVEFYRTTAPSNMHFSDGILSWDGQDTNIADYYLSIILTNQQNGNSYYSFFLGNTLNSFNLQTKINQLLDTNALFATSYRMADSVDIKLYAYALPVDDSQNAFYISSQYGTTQANQTYLSLTTLEAPNLSFNSATRTLSWNDVGQNTYYDIYVDDVCVVEGYRGSVLASENMISINLDSLGDIDWQNRKEVVVKTVNPSYLDSEDSNVIYIKQLAPILNLNISSAQNQYQASFNITTDIEYISHILLNNEIVASYNSSSATGSFALDDPSVTVFDLQVCAKDNGNYYYLDSIITTFELHDINESNFELTLDGDMLKWTQLDSQIVGQPENKIKYTLVITSGGKSYDISTFDLEYSIQEIEEAIGEVLSDTVNIKVVANVLNYTFTQTDGQARGYYGQKESTEETTTKLNKVAQITVNYLVDSTQSLDLDKYLESYAQLSWNDEWSSYQNVKFLIKVSNSNSVLLETTVGQVVSQDYSLSLQDGIYTLRLNKALISAINTTVEITVIVQGNINSQPTSVTISRLNSIAEASVDGDGILTVDVSETQDLIGEGINLLLELRLGQDIVNYTFSAQQQLNLNSEELGLLYGKYGAYSIRIIAIDQNNRVLPSGDAYMITGNKLQGIDQLIINQSGDIEITVIADDLSDIVFHAKTMVGANEVIKTFLPDQNESSNVYTISMLEMLELFFNDADGTSGYLFEQIYNFEITVSKSDSVTADWKEISFGYKFESLQNQAKILRSNDLSRDYIIIGALADSILNDPTRALIVSIRDGSTVTNIKLNSLMLILLRGYWKTTSQQDKGTFVTTQGNDGATYTPCYGVCLNDILDDYLPEFDYGNFEVEISRISNENSTYYQYNQTSFEVKRLNEIINLEIYDNVLSWQWIKPADFMADPTFQAVSYYVVIDQITNDGLSNVKKLLVNSASLDLRGVNEIIPGNRYQISVIALPNADNQTVISSKAVVYGSEVYKYATPISLEVKDGKITFNAEQFETSAFIQDLKDYFGEEDPSISGKTELYQIVGAKTYYQPIEFLASTLLNQRVVLRFILRDGNSDTNTHYDVELFAYQLFPDIEILNADNVIATDELHSYFDLLNSYLNTSRIDQSVPEGRETVNLIETLLSSYRGISGDTALFDDFGRQIPTGIYSVAIFQTEPSGYQTREYIDSQLSNSVVMFVNPAPSVELEVNNRDIDSETNKNFYEAVVNVGQIYVFDEASSSYIKRDATYYKMLMRTNYQEGIKDYSNDSVLEFDIQYISDQWLIYYNDVLVENVITTYSSSNFTINFTLLRDKLPEILEEYLEWRNVEWRIDLYVYTADSSLIIDETDGNNLTYGSLNGKSATINLTYLDLLETSVNFTDGRLCVTIDQGRDNQDSLLVKYYSSGSGELNKIYQITSSNVYIDMDNSGLYSYIILSINGSISYNTMRVESQSYAIANSYKLNSPQLSISNNDLYVSINSVDQTYHDDLHYLLANDLSLQNGDGYYYTSARVENTYILTRIGQNDESELRAGSFYVYLLGNSGNFVLSTDTTSTIPGGADNLLIFQNTSTSLTAKGYPIFSSDTASINARMLHNIENDPFVSSGGISWEVDNDQLLEEDAVNLYQIDIEYYTRLQDEYELSRTETLYTTATSLNHTYLNEAYQYYKVFVTALAGRVATSTLANITTIEGETYNILQPRSYQDGSYVLRGLKLSATNGYLQRTMTPVLLTNMTGISGDTIEFYIDARVYNNDINNTNRTITDENNASASERILIQARYFSGSSEVLESLEGSFIFSSDTHIDTTGLIKVEFVLSPGQLNITNMFDIEIRNYISNDSTALLMSSGLVIENVTKLQPMLEQYYSIGIQQEGQDYISYIDFSNYFESVMIASSNTMYSIIVKITTTSGEEVEYQITHQDNKQLPIYETYQSIQIQIVDNQEATLVGRRLLLNSDITTFNISPTQIGDGDGAWLEIEWDEDNSMFRWSWNEESVFGNNYQYYFNIIIDGRQTSGIIENSYYLPVQGGTDNEITSFYIQARQINQADNTIYLFSDSVNYQFDSGNITYNLFAGGQGTISSPYLIANASQFIQIYKRNFEGQEVYYRLTNNIDLTDELIFMQAEEEVDFREKVKVFYGNIDGNGNTITISASDFLVMSESYSTTLMNLQLSFDRYFALFETISSSASIKNLNIIFNIDINTLQSSNILISPLAVYNLGTIENVTITGTSISNLSGRGDNVAFVGGIVAANYGGTITNCHNEASFNFNTGQGQALRFAYGAISLFNVNDGQIQDSTNSGTKTLRVETSNQVSYLAGITIINSGTILRSGNDGSFDVGAISSVSSFTTYQSGNAIVSSGVLSFCYNNGTLNKSANVGTLNKAAIALTLTGGTINYLADTQGNSLVNSVTAYLIIDNGVNYASAGSTISNQIKVTIIQPLEEPIDAGDGYYFRITSENGGLRVSITTEP